MKKQVNQIHIIVAEPSVIINDLDWSSLETDGEFKKFSTQFEDLTSMYFFRLYINTKAIFTDNLKIYFIVAELNNAEETPDANSFQMDENSSSDERKKAEITKEAMDRVRRVLFKD